MAIELITICQENEGEAFGLPVSHFLEVGKQYNLRNMARGGNYGGELIAEVYDAQGNRVQVNDEVKHWLVSTRFKPVAQIFLN